MSDRPDAWGPRRRAWRIERLQPSVDRLPERSERFVTLGDLPVEGLYGPWDLERDPDAATAMPPDPYDHPGPGGPTAVDHHGDPLRDGPGRYADADLARDLGLPGEPPFTRGVHPTGYRSRPWTMRMFAGFGSAEDTNARFRQLLDAGQTGLSIAYDMPTLYGYDTDDPEAEGEFGTCGVAVSSLADMEIAARRAAARPGEHLDDDQLPPQPRSGRCTSSRPRRPGSRGRASRAPSRTTSSRSTSPRRSSCTRRSRRCAWWSTRSSSGRARCRAGTRSRSVATTSARRARRPSRSWRSRSPTAWPTSRPPSRAACVSTTSRRGSRSSSTRHSDFFEEIAKFRASRRIWWKLMSERYRAENERSTWMRFHTQTAGVSLTPQQPLNNLTRVATQALAAILGGTQCLHTDAYDEALAVPTAEAALLALRQQQVIVRGDRRRVHGGSARRLVVRGGADQPRRARGLALPRRDRPARRHGRGHRRRLSPARDRRQRVPLPARVRRRGAGASSGSTATSTRSRSGCRCSPCRRGRRNGTWRAWHGPERERDGEAVAAALAGLRDAASRPGTTETNLMPHFIRCAEAYATLGEQCQVLREVFGEYREPVSV